MTACGAMKAKGPSLKANVNSPTRDDSLGVAQGVRPPGYASSGASFRRTTGASRSRQA